MPTRRPASSSLFRFFSLLRAIPTGLQMPVDGRLKNCILLSDALLRFD
jgi:hypothetical protein